MRAAEVIMRTEKRLHPDNERALLWLKRSLEWEQILDALRDTGGRDRHEPAPQQQEPAAA
jgi:hypothetical protein